MFASQLWRAREQSVKDIEGTRVVWTYPVKLYTDATKMPRVPCEAFEIKKPQEMNLEELQDIWECWRKWTELKGRGSSCLNHGRVSWGKEWGCNTLKPLKPTSKLFPWKFLAVLSRLVLCNDYLPCHSLIPLDQIPLDPSPLPDWFYIHLKFHKLYFTWL